MRKIILFVAVIAVIAAAGTYFYVSQNKKACTMEAKICPDGSSVGRTGPNCEFAACPEIDEIGVVPNDSGIRGKVVLGPNCPAEDASDPNCASKPYKTTVNIFKSADPARVIRTVASDDSGSFAVALPAGQYIVGAGDGETPLCKKVEVVVKPNAFFPVTVPCDTGIR